MVSNLRLQNIVRDLYKGTTRPGRIGTGTIADAVRSERSTDRPTKGVWHGQKAREYSRALEKSLEKGDLDDRDSLVARSLLADLDDALGVTR